MQKEESTEKLKWEAWAERHTDPADVRKKDEALDGTIVLDLSQAGLASGFRMPAPNGAVAGVRTGKPASGTLRIVFDLGSAMATRTHVEHDGPVTRLIVEMSPLGRTAGPTRAFTPDRRRTTRRGDASARPPR